MLPVSFTESYTKDEPNFPQQNNVILKKMVSGVQWTRLWISRTYQYLQSQTKLLEKVFPIMSTFLRNKTISKTTPLRKENPFPQFNVASHKCPGIRLSFEYTTTLLSGEEGEGRTSTAKMFRKMLSKHTIFTTFLSKIVVKKSSNFQGPKPNSRTFQHEVLLKFKTSSRLYKPWDALPLELQETRGS